MFDVHTVEYTTTLESFDTELLHVAYELIQWRTEGGLEPPHWRVKKILIGLLQPHSSDRHSKADPKQELRIQCI